MELKPIDEHTWEYSDSGQKMLGYITDIEARKFRGADTIAIKKSEGLIIDASGRVKSWPLEKFVEYNGVIMALGPWIADSRPFGDRKHDSRAIAVLLNAVRALKAVGYPLNGLFTRAFRWLPDDGILVMPPKLAAWIRETGPESLLAEAWEPWVHPDREGDEAWSFSLGVLAWRALAGVDPFAGETGEARRERIRRGALPPMDAVVPGVDNRAADLIRRALIDSGEGIPSLDEWDTLIRRWNEQGILNQLVEEEQEELRFKASKQAKLMEDRLKARRWFRKSGWKYAGFVLAIAVAAAFVSAPIGKMLEEPVTIGMTPMEVAATYYDALNSLDSERMEDCVSGRVGREDQRQVDMIFVTHKVRQGYEGLGELPKAAEWLAAGRPELPTGVWPWGITNLKLTELGDGRIQAEYLLWAPPQDEGATQPVGIPRRDILSFAEGRKAWEIISIDRSTGG
jgi:hypothetical protein